MADPGDGEVSNIPGGGGSGVLILAKGVSKLKISYFLRNTPHPTLNPPLSISPTPCQMDYNCHILSMSLYKQQKMEKQFAFVLFS